MSLLPRWSQEWTSKFSPHVIEALCFYKAINDTWFLSKDQPPLSSFLHGESDCIPRYSCKLSAVTKTFLLPQLKYQNTAESQWKSWGSYRHITHLITGVPQNRQSRHFFDNIRYERNSLLWVIQENSHSHVTAGDSIGPESFMDLPWKW